MHKLFLLLLSLSLPIGAATTNDILQMFINQEYDLAIDTLHVHLQTYPDDPNLNYYLGQALKSLDRDSEALDAFIKSLGATDIDSADIHVLIGGCYESRGNESDAAVSYQHALALDTTHVQALRKLALLYQKQGRFSLSIAPLLNIYKLDTTLVNDTYRLGYAFYREGDFEQALKYLEHASNLDPKHFKSRLYMGITQYSLENFVDAVSTFISAMALNADSDALYYYMGEALYKMDTLDAAIKNHQRCVELEGNYLYASLKSLVRYSYIAEKYKLCEQSAQQLIALNNEDMYGHMYRGMALASLGRHKVANEEYHIAIQCSDQAYLISLYSYKATNHRALHEYDEAIDLYQRIICLNPKHIISYYNMAVVYDEKSDDKALAKQYYRDYIDMCKNSDSSSLYLELAENRLRSIIEQEFMHNKVE